MAESTIEVAFEKYIEEVSQRYRTETARLKVRLEETENSLQQRNEEYQKLLSGVSTALFAQQELIEKNERIRELQLRLASMDSEAAEFRRHHESLVRELERRFEMSQLAYEEKLRTAEREISHLKTAFGDRVARLKERISVLENESAMLKGEAVVQTVQEQRQQTPEFESLVKQLQAENERLQTLLATERAEADMKLQRARIKARLNRKTFHTSSLKWFLQRGNNSDS